MECLSGVGRPEQPIEIIKHCLELALFVATERLDRAYSVAA